MANPAEKAKPQPRPEHELSISRVLDAPRNLVFKVWSTPEHLVRWWGPKNFTTPAVRTDFRRCGQWSSTIRSPEGVDYPAHGVYAEINPPERLVFSFSWDEDGERGNDTLITVTLKEAGDGTRLTFHQAFFDTVETRDSHEEGWGECMDRLVDYIAAFDRGKQQGKL
jgi:uncharacterized protein YndB with AHSA1/START domain